MKALIIDDDEFYCKALKDFCNKTNIQVVETFNEPMAAINYLKKERVDIILLDVHMPDLNGFELLDNLPEMNVIVTTQDETSAIKAFDYNVVDFLLKPIEFSRFLKAIQKIEDQPKKGSGSKPDHIYVNINKRLVKVNIEDINFVEAKGNYIQIDLTPKDRLMVHTTMKKVMEMLPDDSFAQVHRSFIINCNKIVDIEDSSIVINRNVIPLGKSHRESLMKKLNLLQ